MKRDSRRGAELVGAVVGRDSSFRLAEQTHAPPVAKAVWEAAVGTRIAARAQPYKLVNGVLFVQTASATWAQELSLLADAIVEHLRARGVELESLRFRVGTIEPPERPPWRQEVRRSPKSVPLPPSVREQLAHVSDAGLRDAIAKAAAKNLGWQQERADQMKPKSPSRKGFAQPLEAPPTSAPEGAPNPQSSASENARSAQSHSSSAGARPRKRGNS